MVCEGNLLKASSEAALRVHAGVCHDRAAEKAASLRYDSSRRAAELAPGAQVENLAMLADKAYISAREISPGSWQIDIAAFDVNFELDVRLFGANASQQELTGLARDIAGAYLAET